jgi:hypothetical protein
MLQIDASGPPLIPQAPQSVKEPPDVGFGQQTAPGHGHKAQELYRLGTSPECPFLPDAA